MFRSRNRVISGHKNHPIVMNELEKKRLFQTQIMNGARERANERAPSFIIYILGTQRKEFIFDRHLNPIESVFFYDCRNKQKIVKSNIPFRSKFLEINKAQKRTSTSI